MADAGRRAKGRKRAASGHPGGSSGRVGVGLAPTGVAALCLSAAGGTGGGDTAGVWTRHEVYIPGWWARRGPVRFMPFGVRVQ